MNIVQMNILPDTPRYMTAIIEWASCMVFLFTMERRYEKKKTVGLTAMFLAGQILLQFAAQELADFTNILWFGGMFLNILWMLLTIFACLRISMKNSIIVCCKAFILAEFTASFGWLLLCLLMFPIQGIAENIYFQNIFMFSVATVILFLNIYMIKKKDTLKEGTNVDWNQTFLAVTMALIIFIISNIGFWKNIIVNRSVSYYVYFIRAIIDMCGLLMLSFQEEMLLKNQMKLELLSIRNILNQQYKQYLDFKEANEYISRQCHDFKHQIQTMRLVCTEEEREAYVKELEEKMKLYQVWNVTGNSTLDTILTQKKLYCVKHGIELTCTADGKLLEQLAVRDICTIFGNILDNAIEATMLLEDEKNRIIHGEVCQKNSFLIIRFENCFHGKGIKDQELPESTKPDKESHGYGLKSIHYTVNKYGGSMTLNTKDSWFIVKILIPLKK